MGILKNGHYLVSFIGGDIWYNQGPRFVKRQIGRNEGIGRRRIGRRSPKKICNEGTSEQTCTRCEKYPFCSRRRMSVMLGKPGHFSSKPITRGKPFIKIRECLKLREKKIVALEFRGAKELGANGFHSLSLHVL